ncbi:archaeal flagellin [Aciduliprofundum sp. MAR08-339]|uniref:flagellin n=1 Tax=Aciduliprofundum sp. (strain MAR08-339) TaxID=673860 RepID=UPI0002A4863B|nr:archaeal flagellin [Aciduliprofundum sp. MAR08-339]
MKRLYTRKEEGDIGIATLILFIAMIIVAAIAASLIIYVGVTLREQGEKVASDVTSQITSSVRILNILGDRDIDGKDPSVVNVKAPIQRDYTPPYGGLILNVTVNSTDPLSVKIVWNSAVDTESGMWKEELYRISGAPSTIKFILKDENYIKSVGTLVATFTSGFGDDRTYVDYGVNSSTYYGYAIIGYDRAGNSVLYTALNQTVYTGTGTPDTTAPTGNIETITPSGYGVMITWTASDSGSGLDYQKIYRSRSEITAANVENATLVATVGPDVRSYIDYPPANGTWYYAIVGYDRAGNSALYSATTNSITVTRVDNTSPPSVEGLRAYTSQYYIHLEWKPVRDNQSGIKGYYIYRSTNYLAVATTQVFNSKPYAFVKGTYFNDYVYMPYQTYYYLVVAVDNASNYGQIIVPQSSIQVLEIKLALGPGSKPVDFNNVIVELTDGNVEASLKLNSSGFGVEAANATLYGVQVVNDPSGEFRQSYILEDGAIIIMYINARDVGLTLTPQTKLTMKIIPGPGIPIYTVIEIPPVMLNRYVEIY